MIDDTNQLNHRRITISENHNSCSNNTEFDQRSPSFKSIDEKVTNSMSIQTNQLNQTNSPLSANSDYNNFNNSYFLNCLDATLISPSNQLKRFNELKLAHEELITVHSQQITTIQQLRLQNKKLKNEINEYKNQPMKLKENELISNNNRQINRLTNLLFSSDNKFFNNNNNNENNHSRSNNNNNSQLDQCDAELQHEIIRSLKQLIEEQNQTIITQNETINSQSHQIFELNNINQQQINDIEKQKLHFKSIIKKCKSALCDADFQAESLQQQISKLLNDNNVLNKQINEMTNEHKNCSFEINKWKAIVQMNRLFNQSIEQTPTIDNTRNQNLINSDIPKSSELHENCGNQLSCVANNISDLTSASLSKLPSDVLQSIAETHRSSTNAESIEND